VRYFYDPARSRARNELNMGRYRTGKRRQKRTKAVVPVRVRIDGDHSSHPAYTLDFSDHGVKLGGIRSEMQVGGGIEVSCRHKRARFRVIWILTHQGSSEKQVGAECCEPEKGIWGVELPIEADEYEEKD